HLVRILDDAATHQAMPDAIDERARQAAVARVGKDRGGGGMAVGERSGGRFASQLGEEKRRRRELRLGDIAAVELQLLLGREIGGERVSVLELPLADEAVVARIALEIDAEEDLRRVLRRLHGGSLAGVHDAAP